MIPAPDGGEKPERHAGRSSRASLISSDFFINALIRVLAKEEYGDF